ncbi:FkbM family methyltransferase [Candidatus Pelagibacter sp.]|jgi:hypothetical protein|nr:FkbM family methyltransferase [Candidatus Pelagibacter sp.]
MLPKYLRPFHINNDNLIRVGPKLDGGYILDKRIIHLTEKIITCGLNDDWEFEKHFLKIKPSCEVIAYDHTVNKKFWIKRFKKDIIHFFLFKKLRLRKIIGIFKYYDYMNFFKSKNKHFELKISNENIKNKEITIDEIFRDHDNLILKIDIEGSEYKVLKQILNNSKKINNLLIEFHDIQKNMNLIKDFIDQSNDLKLIHIHGNNYSCTDENIDPNIIELTFTNIEKIGLEQKITEKNYPIDKLDYKNIPRKKDFILKFEGDTKIS